MLKLILGDFCTGKSTKILEEVLKDTEKDVPVKLLVPEQETVTVEGIFTSALPPRAQLTFEVTSFSRLANTAFRTVGGLAAANADKTARALCMWRALEDLAPKLHREEKPDKTEIDRTLQAVGELRTSALTAEDLETAALTLPEGDRLRDRLEDLGLITSAFSATLHQRTGGGEDELDRLLGILQEHRLFSEYRFYVDSFADFTEQEYRILGALCSYTDVTVALCLPERKQGALCYAESEEALERLVFLNTPPEQWDRLRPRWRTLRRNSMTTCQELLELAASFGARVELAAMLSRPRRKGSAVGALSLIRAPQLRAEQALPSDGGLLLTVADTPFDGAAFVASDIRRRVKKDGLRYRDFAIIAGRAQEYRGILDTALEKADVPYFLSVNTDPEAFEAVKLIHSAYAILRYGWQREDVIAYLKCGLCGIEEEKSDLFELYTETWSIQGKLFTRGEPWEMSPDGFDDRHSGDADGILATVNGVRERLTAPLLHLQRSQKVQSVRLHAAALYHYLTELDLPASLLRRAEREKKEGRLTEASEYERLWGILMETLDRLVEILGDDEVSPETFHDLFSVALSSQSIGSIPSSVDQVTVGSADLLRIARARVVYLFDVSEGTFPTKVSDDSYFSERERQTLSQLGLSLAPRLSKDASRALFCFLRAMMKGEDEAVFVHFSTDAAMAPQELSREVARLKTVGRIPTLSLPRLSPLDWLYSRELASEKAGELYGTPWWEPLRDALGQCEEYAKLEERMQFPIRNGEARLGEETVSDFMGDRFSLSFSAMEKFVKCPMKYWCEYGLALKPEEKAAIDSLTAGTFVHSLMEEFFGLCQGGDGDRKYDLSRLTDGDVEELAQKAASRGIERLFPPTVVRQARAAHIVDRLQKMALLLFRDAADEFAQSQFRPVYRELHIGGKNGPEKLEFTLKDETRLAFGGYVDRVDVMEKDGKLYFRVVDYKTGSKTFSPSDVKKGENLQALLYLVALWKTRSEAFRRDLAQRLSTDASSEDPQNVYERILSAEFLPGGMEYLSFHAAEKPVDRPLGEEEILALSKERLERTGLALRDAEVLRAMDRDMQGRFLPVPKDKKALDLSKSNYLFTLEQMTEHLEAVADRVKEIGEEIRSGEITAKPKSYKADKQGDSPCKYCKFGDVCRALS